MEIHLYVILSRSKLHGTHYALLQKQARRTPFFAFLKVAGRYLPRRDLGCGGP